MASVTTNTHKFGAFSGVTAFASRVGHAIWDVLMQAAESRSRVHEIERLRNLPEAQRKQLGISEEHELIRYAFRDLIAF